MPVDTSNRRVVTRANEIVWAFHRKEVVNMNQIRIARTGKQMATMRKLDFFAATEANRLVHFLQLFTENVHELNLFLESHNEVEARWMEGNRCWQLIRHLVADFQSLRLIVPNVDQFV